MLSSDILEQQFGPTKVVILKQNAQYRLINTVVVATGQILELSVVSFIANGAQMYPIVHKNILAGESIGKAFRNAHIEFNRQTINTTKSKLPSKIQKMFKPAYARTSYGETGILGKPSINSSLVTVVEVSIYVGPQKTHYCDILEIYSPQVVWPDKISGEVPGQIKKLNNIAGLL